MDFMRTQPQLCVVMSQKHRSAGDAWKEQKDVATLVKSMLKMWPMIDTDKNGTLEWEEFIEFFRINGFFLEYRTKDNPKDRMAQILTHLHDDNVVQDASDLDEFAQLKNIHLMGERRRSLGSVEAKEALIRLDNESTETGEELLSTHARRSSLTRISEYLP